jgi:hypothetical protein
MERLQTIPLSISVVVIQTLELSVSELDISKRTLSFSLHLDVILSVVLNRYIYGKLLFVVLSIIIILLNPAF